VDDEYVAPRAADDAAAHGAERVGLPGAAPAEDDHVRPHPPGGGQDLRRGGAHGGDAPEGDTAAGQHPLGLVKQPRLAVALLDVRREARAHPGLRHHVHHTHHVPAARDLGDPLERGVGLGGPVVGQEDARRG
jgi:hypothetical protein